MSLKHGLLGLLSSEGPTTGYDLDKLFKSSLDYFWQAKTSQIYRELSAMEDLGWLTSERVVQEDKPNKRVYSITAEGKKELLDWLMLADTGFNRTAKSPFMMRLFFAGEAGEAGREQAINMIKEYRKKCDVIKQGIAQATKEVSELKNDSDYEKYLKYWKMIVLHGEMFINTSIEWADKATAILEEDNS